MTTLELYKELDKVMKEHSEAANMEVKFDTFNATTEDIESVSTDDMSNNIIWLLEC